MTCWGCSWGKPFVRTPPPCLHTCCSLCLKCTNWSPCKTLLSCLLVPGDFSDPLPTPTPLASLLLRLWAPLSACWCCLCCGCFPNYDLLHGTSSCPSWQTVSYKDGCNHLSQRNVPLLLCGVTVPRPHQAWNSSYSLERVVHCALCLVTTWASGRSAAVPVLDVAATDLGASPFCLSKVRHHGRRTSTLRPPRRRKPKACGDEML